MGNLVLEKAVFAAEESPGDSAAERAYLLSTSFGAFMFEYGKYSDGEYYVSINSVITHMVEHISSRLSGTCIYMLTV